MSRDLSQEARSLLDQARDADEPSDLDRARVRRNLSVALATAAGVAAGAQASAAAASALSAGSTASTASLGGAGAASSSLAASASVATTGGAVAGATVAAKLGAAVTVTVTAAVMGVAGTAALRSEREAPKRMSSVETSVARVSSSNERPHAGTRERALSAATHTELAEQAPTEIADAQAAGARKRGNESVAPRRASMRAVRVAAPQSSERAPELWLQAELDVLSSAQVALRAGDDEEALRQATEHARRFPAGALAIERDAVRAIALCRLGRRSEGQAALGTLQDTPLAARARRACE